VGLFGFLAQKAQPTAKSARNYAKIGGVNATKSHHLVYSFWKNQSWTNCLIDFQVVEDCITKLIEHWNAQAGHWIPTWGTLETGIAATVRIATCSNICTKKKKVLI